MNSILSNPNFRVGFRFGARLSRIEPVRARRLAREHLDGDLSPADGPEADFDFGMFCGVVQTIGLRSTKRSSRTRIGRNLSDARRYGDTTCR